MNPDEYDIEFQAGYDAYIAGAPAFAKNVARWAGWNQAYMDYLDGLLCLTPLSFLI